MDADTAVRRALASWFRVLALMVEAKGVPIPNPVSPGLDNEGSCPHPPPGLPAWLLQLQHRSTVAPTALSKGRSLGQNPRTVPPPSRKPQEQFARNGKRSTGFSLVPEADSATETPARPPCTGGRAQALRAQAEIILRKERTVTAADGNGSHAQDETEKQATDELEQIAPENEGRWPPDQVAAVHNAADAAPALVAEKLAASEAEEATVEDSTVQYSTLQ